MYTFFSQFLIAGLVALAYSTCECGYRTDTQEIFQYALLTDFASTDLALFQSSGWDISSRVLGTSPGRPFFTDFIPSNANVANGSLLLTCSAYNATTSSVPSAQIKTSRVDILYGSFRAQFEVRSTSTGSGAVSAFFFYADDYSEVDIEVLTRTDPGTIFLTNQPYSSTETEMPTNTTRSDLNDYRFDWTPAHTNFFVNSISLDSKTTDVPSVNGSIYLNMWGGSIFAGSPPSSPSIMSVSTIQLYFNTSDNSLADIWNSICNSKRKTKKNGGNICDID